MAKNRVTRRQFLQTGAGAAGALAVPPVILKSPALPSLLSRAGANNQVNFGMIGVGMQGSGLMSTSIQLPGVKCLGAADLYDGRRELAREIGGAGLFTTRRYQELLVNKDIDCIVAAVPDHWHKQVVADVVGAGKDIYCEKPMSHTPADGVAMVAAAKKSGRIVQIGSQRVSSAICAKARELLSQKILGDLTLVEISLGRNDPTGAWEYPPPPDLSPETLDWSTWQGTVQQRPFDPLVFARWRCWKEYGTGVAGDLMVHMVSGALFMLGLNEAPDRAMSMGGILRWKDGRNMPDVHSVLLEYGELPMYLRMNLGTETPEIYRFQGAKGYLDVTATTIAYSPQAGVDTAPSYYTASYPKALRDAYVKEWHAQHMVSPDKEPMFEGFTWQGDSFDDGRPHLWNFFEAVRNRTSVTEDALFGHHAALACHMANASYFSKKAVTWDAAASAIRT
jgi:predicted dehydrogenase